MRREIVAVLVVAPFLLGNVSLRNDDPDVIENDPALCGQDCTEDWDFGYWDRLAMNVTLQTGGSNIYWGTIRRRGWMFTCNHCSKPQIIRLHSGPHQDVYMRRVQIHQPDHTAWGGDTVDFVLVEYEAFERYDECVDANTASCCTGPFQGTNCDVEQGFLRIEDPLPPLEPFPLLNAYPEIGSRVIIMGKASIRANPDEEHYLECNTDPARGGLPEGMHSCCTDEFDDSPWWFDPDLREPDIGGSGSDCEGSAGYTWLGPVPLPQGQKYAWTTTRVVGLRGLSNYPVVGPLIRRGFVELRPPDTCQNCDLLGVQHGTLVPPAPSRSGPFTQDWQAVPWGGFSGDSGSPAFVHQGGQWLFLGPMSAGQMGGPHVAGLRAWIMQTVGLAGHAVGSQ